jgi:hypothetical protein
VSLPPPLPDVETALCRHFGGSPQRASVAFVGVDPIEVLRFAPEAGALVYVTLGMARQPMAGPAAQLDPAGPRAELVLEVDDPADRHRGVWRTLALLAAAPVVEGVVYRAGLSVDLGAPLVDGSRCTGVVVTRSAVAPVESVPGPVAVLRAVPATATELAWCRVHGAAALQTRWAAAGTDLRNLDRGAVGLG